MSHPHDLVVAENPQREQQIASNRRVEAALTEEAERAISIAEMFVSFTTTRLPVLEERNPNVQAALQEFDAIFRWPNPCGWNEQAILQRCQQHLTTAQIKDWLDRPKPNVYDAASLLKDLSGADALPRGKFLLRKEEVRALDHQQDQASGGEHELSAVTIGLYEVLHANVLAQLRAEMAQSDVQRAKLARSIEKYRGERDQAMALSDMVAAEQAHKLLIDAHFEMCELCARRLQQVNEGGDDELQFQKQIEAVKADADATYTAFSLEKHKALQEAEADLERCVDAKRDEESAHLNALAAFQQYQHSVTGELQANLSQQHQLVEEIKAKLAQLSNVCEVRKTLITEFQKEKTKEEQRIAAYSEFLDLADQQTHRLKQLREYLSRCTTIAQSLDQYREEMFRRLGEKDLSQVVALLAREESERFYKEYRDFVYACGDLSMRKMHRFDTLERQVRLTKHNRDTALDSLDPKINKYNDELDQLVASMRDTEGILTTLQATQDTAENLFLPAEQILRQAAEKDPSRKAFVHPLQEFGTKAVEERKLFVERALRFVEDEERQISKKREGINKMKAAAQQEQLQHTNSVRTALHSPASALGHSHGATSASPY